MHEVFAVRYGVNVDDSDVIPRCAYCRQPVVVLRVVVGGEVAGRVAVQPLRGIVGDVTYDPTRHIRHDAVCQDRWARSIPAPAPALEVAA